MVCTGPSSSQRLLVCRLTGDLEFDVNKASMRKDADIFDRAVDQIAAMQSGRGKGMCCQPPLAMLVFVVLAFEVPARARDSSSSSSSSSNSVSTASKCRVKARRSDVSIAGCMPALS